MELDKDQKLNDLFTQAKNEAPKVSFEEMQESFFSHVESPSMMDSATETSNLFTIKTWTIMITSALSTGIIFAFLNGFFNESTVPEEPIIREEQPAIELSSNELMLLELEDSDWINEYEESKMAQPIFSQEEWVDQVKEPEIINPKELTPAPLVFKGKKEKVEDYRFPMLTKEEKKMYAKQKEVMIKSWVKRDKVQKLIPMGTSIYKGGSVSTNAFYMSPSEVTNFEYRTFLFDLLEQGRKEDFLIAKPDQSLWAKDYPEYNQPMVELYFSHPAYNYYPVNNISRAGAEMYCTWLTIVTNEFLDLKKKPRIKNIRIPNVVEWEYAAKGGMEASPYPWGGPYARNSKGCYLANFNPEGESPNEDGAMQTAAVYSYTPNGYGLYCMSGNIAEMVYDYQDNSIIGTKGGSFLSPAKSMQINAPMEHVGVSEPNVNIGFRLVSSSGVAGTKAWEDIERKYSHKMGKYNDNGVFQFPEFSEKEIKVYEKSKKELVSKAGNYGDANFVWIERDTLLMNRDSVHSRDVSIQSTEVTNLEYRTFLYSLLQQNRKEEYVQAMPEESVWLVDSNSFVNLLGDLYLSFPAYDDYPVVGVTQKGVELYCSWYLEEVQKEFNPLYKDIKYIKIRMPSVKEWERAASNKGKYTEYPWEGMVLKNKEGVYLANYYAVVNKRLADGAVHTINVKKYPPSPNGTYDMAGNAAEITLSEQGEVVVKGGSWKSAPEELNIYTSQNFVKDPLPNYTTGFRVVLEYKHHQSREKFDKFYPNKK